MAVAGSRAVTTVNGIVATVLVVLLAAVALVVKPPAPPGIAEFAPQAAKPITKAPAEQGSQHGNGSGACAAGAVCARPSPTAVKGGALPAPKPTALAGVPTALQCFAWPDGSVTQTFDPQSPPCVASWPEAASGNGGATSPGVTAAEIRVAVNTCDCAYAPETWPPEVTKIFAFFNSHFQLYGRKLRPVFYPRPADTSGSQLRAAGEAAAELKPFASYMVDQFGPTSGTQVGDVSTFLAPLLAAKVVVVQGQPYPGVTTDVLRRSAPYLWSYSPATDTTLRNLGEFICRTLPAAGTAQYAKGDTRSRQRKFAILSQRRSGTTDPDNRPLTAQLASCGATAKAFSFTYDSVGDPGLPQLMTQLKLDGYTSLIPRGEADTTTNMQGAATSAGFQPEWILPGDPNQVDDWLLGQQGTNSSAMLGIAWWNKHLPPAEQPAQQAIRAVDPGASIQHGAELYKALQVLASGIQAAGPRLTPATFAAGLHGLHFPNPGAGGAPSFQAPVGLADGFEAIHDFAAWSWSQTTRTNQNGKSQGATCDVYRGKRWSLTQGWPKGPLPFFDRRAPCY